MNIKTSIYLAEEEHRRLRQEARRRGVAMTEMLRRVVRAFLSSGRAGPSRKRTPPVPVLHLGAVSLPSSRGDLYRGRLSH